MKRIDQLTVTRFLSILLVFFYHAGGGIYTQWINFPPYSYLFAAGPTAVAFLYVLSGFVMSIVYHHPETKFDVPGYWRTRFIRFYPLYLISFLLVCLYYFEFMARIKPWKVLVNIFILQAWWPPYAQSFNYASWSMTVEIFFYAVFPFFTMWAYRQSTPKLIRLTLLFWGFTQLVYFILWKGYFPAWELLLVYNPIFHLNTFLMGVVAGIWYLRESPKQPVPTWVNLSLFTLSLVLLIGYTIVSNIYRELPHKLQPIAGLLAPVHALLIVTLSLDKTRLAAIMRHPWLVTLGETAYALYILHVPVIWIYERALLSAGVENLEFILDVTYIPLMILVGLVSYLYIDPPLRRLLKRAMDRIHVPLVLVDLVILTLSVYFSFRLRFAEDRAFDSYRQAMLLMFWSAFILRTVVSVVMNSAGSFVIQESLPQYVRRTALSVTLGSLLVAGAVYAGYIANWIENYPRSIFLLDWVIVLGLSLFVRGIYRRKWVNPSKAVSS
ncbi:MAG: hypothetical protein FJZ87_08105 [Chloroflexi bacterium]|nr:hypothetical protein [Chloroflexota bacterium]